MTEESFRRTEAWFLADKRRLAALRIIDKSTAIIGYISYAVLEIMLFLRRDPRLLRCTAVPLAAFLITTLLRSALNSPRPYEKLNITPLIKKNTKGKSFPSRHTACIVIIAAAWLYVNVPAGIFLMFVSAVIMVIRPLSGVHFPKDVAAGAVLSAVCAVVGFIII